MPFFDGRSEISFGREIMPYGISHGEAIFHVRSTFHKSQKGFISLKKAFCLSTKGFFLVDDTGLEPVTSRTSSGCSYQLS